jgi:hypothetical protein
MTITSKSLTVIIFATIFGGIAFASAMGWWATESSKVPVTFSDGEFAGQANPADIRGSYTFGDISNSFDVTPAALAQAFGIQTDDPAAFAVKDLESLYADTDFEIGTTSIRLFVAYYTGLPFDTTGQEIYLPRSATEILRTIKTLTAEQLAYIEKHTVDAGAVDPTVLETPAAPSPSNESAASSTEYTVKGKTTFGELLQWGMPKETIETLIGASLPDPAMTLKDYASANGLNFETLKPALQAEIDKLKP